MVALKTVITVVPPAKTVFVNVLVVVDARAAGKMLDRMEATAAK